MTTFLQEFQSWYWNCDFDDAVLQAALDATDTATTHDEFQRAFLVLLRSDDIAARGTALDFYDRAMATSRFGETNPFEPFLDEILATAREMLRDPPRPADDIAFEGANHASALLALKNDAGPEDAEAVLAVLRCCSNVDLLHNAMGAAGAVFTNSESPDLRLVALIGEMVLDGSLDSSDRCQALNALRRASGDEATALLVRATNEDDCQIQQDAAWALSIGKRFYAHRALLEGLDAAWPEDERRFAADEVREALALGPHSTYWEDTDPDGSQLRQAHREMRAPTGEQAHRQAFLAMLHSGHVEAVGIALDHFCDGDGLTRFRLETETLVPDVLTVVRQVLAQPLSPEETDPDIDAGANHASALDVLARLAEPQDGPLLVAALQCRDVAPLVGERAIYAAQSYLDRWDMPDTRIITALEEVIFDPSVDMDDRTLAVVALFDVPGPQVTAVLLRAARSSDLPIQVEGTLGLTYDHLIDEHIDLVKELVASWPRGDDEPDRAWLVGHAITR